MASRRGCVHYCYHAHMLTRKRFIGGLVAGVVAIPSQSLARVVKPPTLCGSWKPYEGEPVRFEGVDCCVFVDDLGGGKFGSGSFYCAIIRNKRPLIF